MPSVFLALGIFIFGNGESTQVVVLEVWGILARFKLQLLLIVPVAAVITPRPRKRQKVHLQ
jgi:hypothetical protein